MRIIVEDVSADNRVAVAAYLSRVLKNDGFTVSSDADSVLARSQSGKLRRVLGQVGRVEVVAAEPSPWGNRLQYDHEESQMVVRGTLIPVDTVLSVLADGNSVAEVLREYPELSEDDVRACVAFEHGHASGTDYSRRCGEPAL